MYQPDADAAPLDRAVMALAQTLNTSGWVEEAEMVAGSAAELREAPKQDPADTAALFDALMQVSLAAAGICSVIQRTHPDPYELKPR